MTGSSPSEMGKARERVKLQHFVHRLGPRTREEFLKEWNVPILVQLAEPGGDAQPAGPRFGTMAMNKEEMIFADTGLWVFPLKKAAANAFAMMITVGRAANNDIVLPYDSISKFHAYFSSTPQGWVLTDAKSTNGTYIAGRKVEGDAKEKLELDKFPILELSFSKVVPCKLYTPDSFWDLSRQLLGALSPRK